MAMLSTHLHLSAQAHIGAADVKPLGGGRSQKMNKIFEKFGM
ncbi:hypothetical protein [Parasulfuritortus cantonensis]|nr:hypothetical protein [Parasulfuritortus cantonensis]